jgi:hypothetical protein
MAFVRIRELRTAVCCRTYPLEDHAMFDILFDKSTGRRLLSRAALMFVLVISYLGSAGIASAAKPSIDPTYVDGQTYYMIGPHMITNPNPNLLAHAQELYLVVYPIGDGTLGQGERVLPSGYKPQCDPCYHPGLPPPFVYHDHILPGAPGLGKNGTAGEFKGPWKIILVVYKFNVIESLNFTPIKSATDLDAGEAAGMFEQINPGADNPYEIVTGSVLICPLVSPNA